MKEKLQEYALVAEIVSAVAIVASLVFVGIQIKQGNELAVATTYQSVRDDAIAINVLTVENREVAELLNRLVEAEPLDQVDENRMRNFGFYILHIGDSAYRQFQSGLISEEDLLETLAPVGAYLRYRKMREYFETYAGGYDPDYIAFMREKILPRFQAQ